MILKNKWTAGLLIIATQLTACSDADVANTIGLGAIIGGAIIIGNNTRCEGGYENRCHDFRDRYGYVHQECRMVYDSCAYLVPKAETFSAILSESSSSQKNDGNAQQIIAANVTDVNWGIQFGLSFESSDRFITSMRQAKTGDLNAVLALGLSKEDTAELAKFKIPSAAGIEVVAETLNSTPETVSKMFADLVRTASENKGKIHSRSNSVLSGKQLDVVLQ